ncbi:Group-specific antigen [Heterostelium album PN500]|uniref:Group-specific antigen n=1 Tax=Heterostelium pallidum (strain ATCC 26659 / Pp 5 / PN500) TaxID=670386 RepID=D3BBC5_HETP5|nr:Group-specific antigen [Heterostelium album PN500]EFA81332.1 Group-specific antigen [Heterostelium album PN500]|eukprot:XP_020433450.1 Group-specific antigen [Heterostelium album PN500]
MIEDAKSFKNTMTLSRAVHHWKNGGISLWDMKLRNDAQHIWILNRVIANQDVYSPYYQSWRNQIRHNKITSPTLKHSILLWQHFRPIMKLPPHQMKPILRNDEPLPLKLIYHNLINHHHKPVLTSGQFQLSLPPTKIDFTSNRNIFYYINSIKHHRGRNTVFRFFSGSLPVILNKFTSTHHTTSTNCHYEDEWSLEKSTTHFYLCDESSDLTAIIYHNIWKHVNSILFSQDDKILDFSNQSIISDFDIHRNILKLINNIPTPAN